MALTRAFPLTFYAIVKPVKLNSHTVCLEILQNHLTVKFHQHEQVIPPKDCATVLDLIKFGFRFNSVQYNTGLYTHFFFAS